MTRRANLLLVAALALTLGCRREPPKLWILMENKTGEHMGDFSLDHGSGRIAYQIFSRDYTFSARVRLEKTAPLRLRYTDVSGATVEQDLDWTADPKRNGGKLMLTFLPQKKVEIRYSMFQE